MIWNLFSTGFKPRLISTKSSRSLKAIIWEYDLVFWKKENMTHCRIVQRFELSRKKWCHICDTCPRIDPLIFNVFQPIRDVLDAFKPIAKSAKECVVFERQRGDVEKRSNVDFQTKFFIWKSFFIRLIHTRSEILTLLAKRPIPTVRRASVQQSWLGSWWNA